MKKLLFGALALVSLVGCAAQKSAEQLAEEARYKADIQMRINKVQVSRAEPVNCQYLSGVTAVKHGWNLEPGTYAGALEELKKEAFKKGSNYAVIDSERQPSTMLSTGQDLYFHYHINGRLFKCP